LEQGNNNSGNLVFRLKKGEKDALQELINLYGVKIYRFAFSYLKNKSDTEELLQDIFIKIWEKRKNLDPGQNMKPYLYKIVVNSIYDLIRKKNREKLFAEYISHHQPKGADSSWNEIIWNEMRSNLDRLIGHMPEQRQKIFLLSREEGLKNHEIADRLNLSLRTVENQLYRAVLFLKENLNMKS
jgi:RNA polymerase sigma-70 factor (ECF subfamily)